MTTATLNHPKVENKRSMTTHDRCDRCNAQAFGVATLGDNELFFCGHHFRKNELALVASGWDLEDYTHLIDDDSSVSANKG